ncbi:GAP family protein [Micromonospora auratinigra]|uniref:Sap, sulfolipid-1-addressing protein n=1 Tax=Micromonospora auratinigra TaxID=261654 RepID=A0A1A8YZI7_9ACTN|nr:GAP family protein [Micromonospora auratinigra]SBT37123.1 Sap, sulfolipid-1-addressing protein [Micromonospora auratinigra]
MNLLTVLPMAIVMVAGPQLISAVFLAASRDPRRSSLAYLAGAALGTLVALTVWYGVFRAVRHTAGNGTKDSGSRHLIDWIVLALLVVLMVIVFLRRKRNQPPSWMVKLEDPRPAFAFGLGALLFVAMPSDEVTMASVAGSLAGHDKPWWHLLPFLVLTVLLLALPLLAVVLLGQRAARTLPRLRDWANAHSWIISEIVILIFVAIVGSDLAS